MSIVLFFSLLMTTLPALAQVPDTDIFWCDLQASKKKMPILGKPYNITQRTGYDNQPCFINDREMLYVAMDTAGKQSDIYWYGGTAKPRPVTDTDSTSEFSPRITADGKHITAVLIERDGSSQRLWQYSAQDISDESKAQLWLRGTDTARYKIGYYCPVGRDTIVAFVLGTPFTLQIFSRSDTVGRVVASHIGRCLQTTPNKRAISFVQDIGKGKNVLKQLIISTLDIKTIATMPPDAEDYAYLPNGNILSSVGSKLWLYDPQKSNKQWQLVADWTAEGIKKMTRIAVSPSGKKIAIVAETAH